MEQIVIKRNGEDIPLISKRERRCVTAATASQQLNGEDKITITVVSAKPMQFFIGDTLSVFGKTYALNQNPQAQKSSPRLFEYELTFESVQYELLDVVFFKQTADNNTDYVTDGLTTDLRGFMENLIFNANRKYQGAEVWILGTCPEHTATKTETFDEQNCLAVLQSLCSSYKVNFRIDEQIGTGNIIQRVINLFENESNANNTLPFNFEYGRTGGVYQLSRKNVDNSNIVTRLYSYGGKQNLGNGYNDNKLCLPVNRGSLAHKTKNKSYLEATTNMQKYGVKESCKTFDDIYPQAKFIIYWADIMRNDRFWVKTCKESYKGTDAEQVGIFDINQYLIAGEQAKITMQSGNCAGYEFTISKFTFDNSSPENAYGEFIINTITDENGYVFPSVGAESAFSLKEGDEFIIHNITMPESYIVNAQNRLLTAAQDYLNEHSVPHVSYSISIDRFFMQSKLNPQTKENPFEVGKFVHIQDADFDIDKDVQITAVKRDLIDDFSFELTIGESASKNLITRISNDISSIKAQNTTIVNNQGAADRYNYQRQEELKRMVFDTEGNYYSDKIAPLSIDTTKLSVGARSREFTFVDFEFETNVVNQESINYNAVKWGNANAMLSHAAILDANDNPKTWHISPSSGTVLLNTDNPYYIYAKCEKSGNSGTILLSESQLNYDGSNSGDSDYYYFLAGILSSPSEISNGVFRRSATLTYGSTNIDGRFITTGRIQSQDGNAYMDLDSGVISGKFNFKDGLITNGVISNDVLIGESETECYAGITGKDELPAYNLLPGSVDFSYNKRVDSELVNVIISVSSTLIRRGFDKIFNVLHFVTDKAKTIVYWTEPTLTVNETYTLSFWAKGTARLAPEFAKDTAITINSSEWKKYTITAPVKPWFTSTYRFGIYSSGNCDVYIAAVKLELGTEATPWRATQNEEAYLPSSAIDSPSRFWLGSIERMAAPCQILKDGRIMLSDMLGRYGILMNDTLIKTIKPNSNSEWKLELDFYLGGITAFSIDVNSLNVSKNQNLIKKAYGAWRTSLQQTSTVDYWGIPMPTLPNPCVVLGIDVESIIQAGTRLAVAAPCASSVNSNQAEVIVYAPGSTTFSLRTVVYYTECTVR